MRTMPCASNVYAAPAPSPRIANWAACATAQTIVNEPSPARSLDVLRDVDRRLVGDDVLPVELRDVDEVVRAGLEDAEPGRRWRPRRREPQEIDVLRCLERSDDRFRSERIDPLRHVHERQRGDPGTEVLRLELRLAEGTLARRLHVGEVLLE